MYPVGTRHAAEPVDDYIESAARQAMVIHCVSGQDGDILVFMPGGCLRQVSY
jgi:ATP-dependent RNA helicase DHX33